MKIQVVNQHGGNDRMHRVLNTLFANPNYSRVRILMAFARGSGVSLLSTELTGFLDRGGRAEAIIGLDLDGTSPDALDSLLSNGVECWVFGAAGQRTFHPKVVLFDDGPENPTSFAAVIGSNNWTASGLDTNFEAAVLVEGQHRVASDSRFSNELDNLWQTYRNPARKFNKGNLRKVDTRLLHRLAARMGREAVSSPDQKPSDITNSLFPAAPVKAARAKRATRSGGRPTTATQAVSLPNSLFLEVVGPETAHGSEIQVPIDVLREYFGIRPTDTYYMRLAFANGVIEDNSRLRAHSRNSTYRLGSKQFALVPLTERPMIVQLDRTGQDAFRVTLHKKGSSGYATAKRKCDRGGGSSKRWGVH